MIKVNDDTKNAYLRDSVRKEITITFPNANITYHNDDIVSESLEIEEAINDGDELTFQGCIATKMKFQCDAPVRDLRGEYVEVGIQAYSDNTEEDIQFISLFKGYIDEQTNRTQEDVVTEFTAYDSLYKIGQTDVSTWYNGLTFPISIRNFRNSLFTYLGITQDDVTLPNDGANIEKVETKDQLLALDVMKAICQSNASFGQLGRDGKFYYRTLTEITKALYPSTETFPSEETFPSRENSAVVYDYGDYIKVTYEPYSSQRITSVWVIGKDGTKTVYGNGTNVFAVADNIVAQGAVNKSLLAENIYINIFRIEYIPSNVEARGLPWVECGDIYMFNTRKNIVRAYVLNRVLKGIQALYDSITAEGSQYREAYQESEQTQASTREDDIQKNNKLVVNEIEARTISVNTLRAQMIEADNINANNISAVNANLNTLSAREANFENATVASLNAANASINYLASIAITTQNLRAQNIDAGQIRTGTISADRISADTIAAKCAALTVLRTNSLLCSGGGAGGNWAVVGTLSGGVVYSGGVQVATQNWVAANFVAK